MWRGNRRRIGFLLSLHLDLLLFCRLLLVWPLCLSFPGGVSVVVDEVTSSSLPPPTSSFVLSVFVHFSLHFLSFFLSLFLLLLLPSFIGDRLEKIERRDREEEKEEEEEEVVVEVLWRSFV